MTRDIWAVVPVKDLAQAKRRLGSVLAPPERRRFVLAMLSDVLAALELVDDLVGVIVVTSDPDATTRARDFGARVLTDGAGDGYSGAVNAAARVLASEGRGGMLVAPADIPLATAEEFTRLLRDHPQGRAVSLVPAQDGRGTNAVVLTPPNAMPLEYEGDSFSRHVERGRGLKFPVETRRLRGIELDIDLPSDLDHLIRNPEKTEASRILVAMRPRAGGHTVTTGALRSWQAGAEEDS